MSGLVMIFGDNVHVQLMEISVRVFTDLDFDTYLEKFALTQRENFLF